MPTSSAHRHKRIPSRITESESRSISALPKKKPPTHQKDKNIPPKSQTSAKAVTISRRNDNAEGPQRVRRRTASEQVCAARDRSPEVRGLLYAEHLLDHNRMEDEHESEQVKESCLVSTSVPNNTANKMQLRQGFFDLHFGATSHVPPVFVYEVLDINNPKKTALTAAMDTLRVAQLATTFHDEHLAATSRQLYVQAMHRLKEKIGLVSKQRQLLPEQFDEIVATIHALIPCAWFDCVKTSKCDWMRHTQGLNRIVELYGEQSLSSAAREPFYRHWERRAFGSYLAQRKRMPCRGLHTHDTFAGQNDESFFKSCVVRIPEVLERTDALLNTKSARKQNSRAVIEILTALGNCAAKIKRWHLHWLWEMPSSFHTVNTKSFLAFSSLCKEHIDAFPTAYTFSSAVHERELRLSHIALLEILRAIIDVHYTYANICAEAEMRPQLQMATRDAKAAADSLCMHVPWSTQDHRMAFAATSSLMPFYHAAEYYKKNGHMEQLRWCHEVSQSLSGKYGISIEFSVGRVNWIANV